MTSSNFSSPMYELSPHTLNEMLLGTQVSILSREFNHNYFTKARNNHHQLGFKPEGGLWCCPYRQAGRYISSWDKKLQVLIKTSILHRIDHSNGYYETVMLFNFNLLTRFYIINSFDDVQFLGEKYGNPFPDKELDCKYLNYSAISEDYDAIFLTPKGLIENFGKKDYKIGDWDVSSMIVLNKECINLESIRYRNYSEILDERLLIGNFNQFDSILYCRDNGRKSKSLIHCKDENETIILSI